MRSTEATRVAFLTWLDLELARLPREAPRELATAIQTKLAAMGVVPVGEAVAFRAAVVEVCGRHDYAFEG